MRVRFARRSRDCFLSTVLISGSGLLRFLHDDLLAGIADALALVGLRRTEGTDVGSYLSHDLLVAALDQDLRLRRRLDRDALRRLEDDRMRETQRQVQITALHAGAVTNADQLQLALEALADAGDHVVEQRAQGPGHGPATLIGGSQVDVPVLDLHLDARRTALGQGTLRTLDLDLLLVDRPLDALRQRDRLLGNSWHVCVSLGHDGENLAPQALLARLSVRHHAPGGGDDADAKTAQHLRQVILATVLAQARTAHATELFDDGTSLEILEEDLHLPLARADLAGGDIGDVALFLEDTGDFEFQLGSRHADALLASGLRILDAREHVGDWISHAHYGF